MRLVRFTESRVSTMLAAMQYRKPANPSQNCQPSSSPMVPLSRVKHRKPRSIIRLSSSMDTPSRCSTPLDEVLLLPVPGLKFSPAVQIEHQRRQGQGQAYPPSSPRAGPGRHCCGAGHRPGPVHQHLPKPHGPNPQAEPPPGRPPSTIRTNFSTTKRFFALIPLHVPTPPHTKKYPPPGPGTPWRSSGPGSPKGVVPPVRSG